MPLFSYVIASEHNGMTIKSYLKNILRLSTRVIIKLKKVPDGITVCGSHAKTIDILHTDDLLSLHLPSEIKEYENSDVHIDIIFEDQNFLIINKPPRMTVYKCGNVEKNLLSAVSAYYSGMGESIVFRPFYRLDRDTSGIIAVAKNPLVMYGTVLKKEYFAVCQGLVPEIGTISEKIGLESGSKIKRTTGFGDNATTEFQRISYDGENSLVKFILLTGRTHQIRVHMSSIGHPVCGDDLYGGNHEIIERQALHCKNLQLIVPAISMNTCFSADFPSDITGAFPKLFGIEPNL